jgi:hypothetical protein
MQEKEVMTQPRIDTAVLIDAVEAVIGVSGGELHKLLVAVADRLKEQEATIRHLRVEICNASAVAMENREVALKLKRSACDTFLELREIIAKLRY